MSLRKKTVRLVGTLAVAAMMLTLATPQKAEAAATDCPQGWFCLFENSYYGGRMLRFQYSGDLVSYGFQDRASSYINNTPYTVTLRDSHWYGDDTITVGSWARSTTMGSWGDRVDKLRVNR